MGKEYTASDLNLKKSIEQENEAIPDMVKQHNIETASIQLLEPIGVISSKSTTTIFNADILEDYIKEVLLGRLTFFIHQEGRSPTTKIVLAQITKMRGINIWHEDNTLRAVVKKKGRLDYLSGETDIKYMRLDLIGVYEVEVMNLQHIIQSKQAQSNPRLRDTLIYNSILQGNIRIKPSSLFTPPLSGTFIYLLDNNLQEVIVQSLYRGYNIIKLGYIYGSNTPACFNLSPFTLPPSLLESSTEP
jgi:hypothetical protein